MAIMGMAGCASVTSQPIRAPIARRDEQMPLTDRGLAHEQAVVTCANFGSPASAPLGNRTGDPPSCVLPASIDFPPAPATPDFGNAIAYSSTEDSSHIHRLPPTELELERITCSEMLSEQWAGILSDHREFYSPGGLTWLLGGIGAGAVIANTRIDEQLVRDTYVENIVLAPSHEFYETLHQPKFFGDGLYTIPVFAVAALAEPMIDELPLGPETAEWGQRSLRTILVGAPPLLGLQLLTGGGRPGETDESSEWQPLEDNNGVSGHAFMGAIPFISAAKMTDNLWLKGGLYAASTLPAISRINDDDHYFSQVFLGWWLAYLAESAVDRSHNPRPGYSLVAAPQPGGIQIGMEYVR
jgi:hypothetical protein